MRGFPAIHSQYRDRCTCHIQCRSRACHRCENPKGVRGGPGHARPRDGRGCGGCGCRLPLKTAVCAVRDNRVVTRGINGHEEFSFKILIAADGPRSTIARMYGMERAPVYLAGIQAEGRHDCAPGLVELYPDASPEFFGWVIPSGNGRSGSDCAGLNWCRSGFLHLSAGSVLCRIFTLSPVRSRLA